MKNFILIVFIIGALIFSGACVFATNIFRSSAPLTQEKIVSLPKGAGLRGTAKILKDEGIIEDANVFTAFALLTRTNKKLQAGEYQFAPGDTMAAVLAKIARGDVYKRNVTIPEGKTSFEIVERIKAVSDLDGDVTAVPTEGTLLPSTYQYKFKESRVKLLKRMQDNLRDQVLTLCGYGPDDAARKMTIADNADAFMNLPCPLDTTRWNNPSVAPTMRNILTLASIVEKETGIASERKRIAGVFLNRLRINMPLQSDPTVIYGITMGAHKNDGQGPLGRRLLLKDLQQPSAYNTYTNVGLPPGPIANAGIDSIAAVLSPEANNFLFFVADGKGGHVFAATLDEHNRNVSEWRKIRAEKETESSKDNGG